MNPVSDSTTVWNRPLAGVARTYRAVLQRLARETTSGKYIPEIDGLRFVAIATVFLHHLNAFLAERSAIAWDGPPQDTVVYQTADSLGSFGVQLFFVVSGFVLALPFASHYLCGTKPVSLRAYFLRRVSRLEPPYLLNLTLLVVLLYSVKHIPLSELLPHYAASCLYLHNVVYGTMSTINCVAWSLEIEVQFYVLAPLLARLFAVRGKLPRRLLLAALIGATTAASGLWIPHNSWLAMTLLNSLQFFLTGFLIADIYLTTLPGLRKGGPMWQVLGFAGWLALLPLLRYPFFATYLLPAAFLPLFLAVFQSRFCNRLWTLSWVTTIGGMCYSIYLLHFSLISAVGRATTYLALTSNYAVNLILQVVVVGVPVVAVSAVYFWLVEKPCMRKDWPAQLLRALCHLGGKRRHPAAEAVAAAKAAPNAVEA